MRKAPESIATFLSGRRIGVAGVSRDPHQAANAVFRKLKDAGYETFAINPNVLEVEGTRCFRDVGSVPGQLDGVVVVTSPDVSVQIVRQCRASGVRRVWFHRSFGNGSVSDEAVRECKQHGLECIVGGCPLMFCEPIDFGHKLIHLRSAIAITAVVISAVMFMSGCDRQSPTAPEPPSCNYVVTPSSADVVAAAGQAITVHVQTTATCTWSARSQVDWITLSTGGNTGPGDIVLTVAANQGAAERSGAVTIGEREFGVRQSGRVVTPCQFVLTSPSGTFGPEGGKGHLALQTSATCNWAARSMANWLTVRTTSGMGPGEIEYEVSPFDGTEQRQTTIIVEQASFTVRQDPRPSGPCQYAVDPTSTLLHWHGAVGEGLEIRLTTTSQCAWSVTSGASWIELVTPGSGTGSAVIRVRVGAYASEVTRLAPVMVRWPGATVGQNVWLTQEGCRYALGPLTELVGAAGGRRHGSVFATPVTTSCAIGCPWELGIDVQWIHFTGSTTGSGDDDFFYNVDTNTTGARRTGAIRLTTGGVITVTQEQ